MDQKLAELARRVAELETAVRGLGQVIRVTEEGLAVHGPLRVVDADGRAVAEISLREGRPYFSLLTPAGEPAVLLDVVSTGGSISVHDPSGRTVGLLFADETGGDLALYDRQGNVQFSPP